MKVKNSLQHDQHASSSLDSFKSFSVVHQISNSKVFQISFKIILSQRKTLPEQRSLSKKLNVCLTSLEHFCWNSYHRAPKMAFLSKIDFKNERNIHQSFCSFCRYYVQPMVRFQLVPLLISQKVSALKRLQKFPREPQNFEF